MARSSFIQRIAKEIEKVCGVELESTKPKEIKYLPVEPIQGKVISRTAEETQNMDVVHLKQFDPYFQNSDIEIPCQVPGCSETRKFVQECQSREKSKKIKRDLFLCKAHRKKLTSSILKYCHNENVTLDAQTVEEKDFTGYASLIGVLEKAFMHLQSKWLRGFNDFLFAEIFLNTRNFLLITNALLNPDEDNTATVLGPYLTLLLQVLADPRKVPSGGILLQMVMGMILMVYDIAYDWIHMPIANPGAKLGTAVGIVSGLLAVKIFNGTRNVKLAYFFGIVVAGGLFGGALFDWNINPFLLERRNHERGLKLYRVMIAAFSGTPRQMFHAEGDVSGNMSINMPDQ